MSNAQPINVADIQRLKSRDTLQLNEQQWRQLLIDLSAKLSQEQPADNEQRAHQRHTLITCVRCAVRPIASENPEYERVYTHDISDGGISLFYHSPLEPGTRVSIALRKQDGGGMLIDGTVRWCRQLIMHIHRVGIQFATTVDALQFVGDEGDG